MALPTVSLVKEALDIIKEAGGETARLCYQCALCNTACPWNTVGNFMVRKLVRQAQFGLVDFEDDSVWRCVTCAACVKRCPRGVGLIDIMRALRRAVNELGVGQVPASLRMTLKNISGIGNPLGEPPEKRVDWAKGLAVKTFTREMEVLYFPCCIPAYVPEVQRVARATVNVLQKAGVDFGILAAGQVCCGESVRKAGQEGLFRSLAQANMNAFVEAGVKKIVTTSPHCYYTFKNEYSEFTPSFEVVHISQYLVELIKEGRLKFSKKLNKRITYHDPCYLGRHSGIYNEPRVVLKSVPGLELVEMPNSGEDSLCCGGGGGGIWLEARKGERLADFRLAQAVQTGASILALACPYCTLNFDASRLTLEGGSTIEVKDIAEIIQEAI